jgi:hypothetical protein
MKLLTYLSHAKSRICGALPPNGLYSFMEWWHKFIFLSLDTFIGDATLEKIS